ncbi:hypothetical protein G9A89_012582 [Geosiphon pyriformis]|nr:hypothetical protein G9A89_012582 [Geosiphon pyriformis]
MPYNDEGRNIEVEEKAESQEEFENYGSDEAAPSKVKIEKCNETDSWVNKPEKSPTKKRKRLAKEKTRKLIGKPKNQSPKKGLEIIKERSKATPWTLEEDKILFHAIAKDVNWAEIANQYFPSRNRQGCRGRWLTLLRRMEKAPEKSTEKIKAEGVKEE